MVQALMKALAFAASLLAISGLTISLSAQEAAQPIPAAPQLSAAVEPTFASSLAEVPVVAHAPLVAPPEQPDQHPFFDRQQRFALYAHSGMRIADSIKTCRVLSHGGREDWIPTQSCAGIAAWQAGSVGVALGVGWLFHKTGHHRLERITPWVGTTASFAGLTKSVFNIH